MLISAIALNKAGSLLVGLFRKTRDAEEPEAAGEPIDCIINCSALSWSKASEDEWKSVLWVEKLDARLSNAVNNMLLAQIRSAVSLREN